MLALLCGCRENPASPATDSKVAEKPYDPFDVPGAAAVPSTPTKIPEPYVPPPYDHNVEHWEIVTPPSRESYSEFHGFLYRANYSQAEWSVKRDKQSVMAFLSTENNGDPTSEKPAFEMTIPPKQKPMGNAVYTHKVSDGWLAGFNRGEFGAALWWFSTDGKTSYHISDHQINQFIAYGERVFAVEGLAHLGMSDGSLIEIQKEGEKWVAKTFVELPDSGEAVMLLPDGRFCVVTSQMLLAVTLEKKMELLLPKAEWGTLYPNSIVIDAKGKWVYVGMRQFVVRYDMEANDHSMTYLIPGKEFLNKREE